MSRTTATQPQAAPAPIFEGEADEAVRNGFSTNEAEALKLDPAGQIKFHMIRAHVMIKNGYNSIVKQVNDNHSNDLDNWIGYLFSPRRFEQVFTGYSSCFKLCANMAYNFHLGIDHDAEERHLFPYLATKLDLQEELQDHKVIHGGIDDMLEWVTEVKKDHSKYSSETLKGKLSRIGPTLFKHLTEEVEHLSHENLSQFPPEGLEAAWGEVENYAKKHADPFMGLPFAKSHTPPEYKWWPSLGWFLTKVLPPLFSWKYSGYWKYSPYPTR
ncbi:hypothetical protein BT69DRAFT_1328840 [Atractiella rhizophila]|nr:hypothetical protein BT69DRAFT_1328840 [Atractiella rhizophila]